MSKDKFDNDAVAQMLENLASRIRKGDLYVVDSAYEDIDFETMKIETTVRSGDAAPDKRGNFLLKFQQENFSVS